MRMRMFRGSCAVLLVLVTSACGGGATTAPSSTAAIALSGTLAFGAVELGRSAQLTMTISNSGSGKLSWTAINTGNTQLTASPTTGTVAAGGAATVTVTYAPSTGTSIAGNMTVASDAISGINTIPVSGRGGTAVLSINGTNILYGSCAGCSTPQVPTLRFAPLQIGASATQPIFVSTSGTGILTVTDMKLGGWLNDVQHFSISPTAFVVNPGQTKQVNVTFAPKFATGLFFMDTMLTVVGDQSGGDASIGLHGCFQRSC